MEYYTYWSILDTPSNSIKPYSIFLIMLIISVAAFIFILKFPKSSDKKVYLILISLFITLSLPAYIYLKFFIPDSTEERITKSLKSSRVKRIEGQISNYKRESQGKTIIESFNIDTVNFKYYDNTLYQFHHFGGNRSDDLYNGLQVKITYAKGNMFNEILKLEIAKTK